MQLASQQTPGQAAAQVLPQVKVPIAAHVTEFTSVQAPVVELQHLPTQGLGEQTLVAPW